MVQQTSSLVVESNPVRLEHPVLAFVHDYWNRKRGERAMPKRSEIHASDLRQHLPWLFIVEAVPDQNNLV